MSPLQFSDLVDLIEPRGYPAVSLLAPLQSNVPRNRHDPLRLRALVEQARDRLAEQLEPQECATIVEQLGAAVRGIDLDHPSPGVAVFVAPGESHVLALPFAVPERVLVDETFATRDLVHAIARNPRYRVLALAEKPTRLFEGTGAQLAEITGSEFPKYVEGARGEPLESGGHPVRTARSDAEHRRFFREVDRALAMVHAPDPLPLVVAGVQRDLAFFDEVTSHRDWVAGTLSGNHEETAAHEIGAHAAPLMATNLAARRSSLAAELTEAIGTGRGLVGIKPAWDAVRAGRARILLVEDDFVYPARVVDGQLEPAGDAGTPAVMDDAVDEMIEMTLERGGDVVVYDRGELGQHGPIALLLRY